MRTRVKLLLRHVGTIWHLMPERGQILAAAVVTLWLLAPAFGGYVLAGALTLSGVAVIPFLIRWSRHRGLRIRIAALTCIYTAVIIAYSGAYYAVFVSNPLLYSFGSGIAEAAVYQRFTDYTTAVSRDNMKIYCVSVAAAELQKTTRAMSRTLHYLPSSHDTAGFVRLRKGLSLRGIDSFMAMGPGTLRATLLEFDGEIRIALGGTDGWHPEVSSVERVLASRDDQQLLMNLDRLRRVLASQRERHLQQLRVALSGQPEWGVGDFVYFSAITMSTVGFGDIVPNATFTRMLVLSQCITGVFFVAFAFYLLWPEAQQGLSPPA
jgi:hypothetical protein